MAKRIKLPSNLKYEMIDFISHMITFINADTENNCSISISDSYTDTKIVKIFEQVGFWAKVSTWQPEKKRYERLSNDLMDYLLLEELNKEIKRGKKKNTSD